MASTTLFPLAKERVLQLYHGELQRFCESVEEHDTTFDTYWLNLYLAELHDISVMEEAERKETLRRW